MEAAFWESKWQRGEIGFHLDDVNPSLVEFFPELKLAPGDTVFVPLCGKSLDMLWLAEQGVQVIGVELVREAVVAFFEERALTPRIEESGEFRVFRAGAYTIWQGDVFKLPKAAVHTCTAIYDRAALIALPLAMRVAYADTKARLFPKPVPSLLITLDYPQDEAEGPPFSVSAEEVQRLYGARYEISCLDNQPLMNEARAPKHRDLSRISEAVYRLWPKG